jgi:hypothetical protein
LIGERLAKDGDRPGAHAVEFEQVDGTVVRELRQARDADPCQGSGGRAPMRGSSSGTDMARSFRFVGSQVRLGSARNSAVSAGVAGGRTKMRKDVREGGRAQEAGDQLGEPGRLVLGREGAQWHCRRSGSMDRADRRARHGLHRARRRADVAGIGISMCFPTVANTVMSSVPLTEAGVASGTNNMLRELGGVFGISS